jgi:hypothetical protein
MIKLKEKKKNKRKSDPYYLLEFDYMIGDADGQTSEEVVLSVDNPFIERFVTLINGLKPTKGTWGIVFEEYNFEKFYDEKQLTKNDYDFLRTLMFEIDFESEEFQLDNTFKIEEKDEDYAYEFFEGVRGQAEYSFLVFQGVTLYYYDEYGVEHETYFEKENDN